MKNGVAYKNKSAYLKINIYLNQASTLPFKPMLPLCRNQSTDLQSTSMGRFLYNGNTGLKQANPKHPFFGYIIFSFHEEILLPFPQMSNLTRLTFHKSITQRMQTENLPSNGQKNFYVILNTNQIIRYIPILICWKKIT